jgi:hypothetical protein
MGYTTDFTGAFRFDKALTPQQADFIRQFSDTRRMKRDAVIVATMLDPTRTAAGIADVGPEGAYFVGGSEFALGQARDASILDYNKPPSGQPGLWCQWTVDHTGFYLGWNGAEKFYHYVEWLEYLIKHLFEPWGVTLNGVMTWQGEEVGDVGIITVTQNKVEKTRHTLPTPTHTQVVFDM